MNMVMSEAPVMHEQVAEVTESGLNPSQIDPNVAKAGNSDPDVYFHMKSMARNSKFDETRLHLLFYLLDKSAPVAYLLAQSVVLCPIVIGHFTTSSGEHHAELIFLL